MNSSKLIELKQQYNKFKTNSDDEEQKQTIILKIILLSKQISNFNDHLQNNEFLDIGMLVNFNVNEEMFTGIITNIEDTRLTVSYIDPQLNQKTTILLSIQNVTPCVSNSKLLSFYNNLMMNSNKRLF